MLEQFAQNSQTFEQACTMLIAKFNNLMYFITKDQQYYDYNKIFIFIRINMSTKPSRSLETFDNPHPSRDYTIRINTPEFTCLCPKTGQPDFATLELEYVPDKKCVELKSFKLYVWSFRDEGAFHEDITNQILNDLVSACLPRFMRLTAIFQCSRRGIHYSGRRTPR